MRLSTTIHLFLSGAVVTRAPSLWDRLQRAFGGAPDLSTSRIRLSVEATALVGQIRQALRRLGIDNAVSLVVDGHVVFSDPVGRPDDFGDLVLALSENAPVFGGGFESLRLAVEHEEAGLHAVIEIDCRSEHERDEPSATVRVGARVRELEPRSDESAESYRRRVEPLVANPTLLEGHRCQFESFVGRLADALRGTFPEGRVEERAPEAKIVRPTAQAQQPTVPDDPSSPAYDPYVRYYPHPFEGMLSGLLIGSLLSSAFRPPIMVVHPSGVPIASADDLEAHAAELAPGAPDPGAGGDDFDDADPDDGDLSGDDAEDFDDSGGDWGGDDFGGDP
jgi:hypothetical protein